MSREVRQDSESMSVTQRISFIPLRHTKTVHFIRHAQGFHNRAGEKRASAYKNPRYRDAHLTETGWHQVEGLRNHLEKLKPFFKVDLVIVSPMTRTLETACGLFGNMETGKDNGSALLMSAQTAADDLRSAHESISASGCPPFLAVESCRERCDDHPCDQRRTRSYYQKHFPAVDFSQIASEEDLLFGRESTNPKGFIERIHKFLEFLTSRPESDIVVVSHSGFLRNLCHLFGSDLGPGSRSVLHEYFQNCEMRSVVMCEKFGSTQSTCDVSHPGGTLEFNADCN